jgi:hypothetical protein
MSSRERHLFSVVVEERIAFTAAMYSSAV